MATEAERSRELAARLEAEAITHDGSGYDKEWYEERAVELIEQALLAERRQIVDLILLHKRAFRNEACRANLVEAIRAAAEKEVAK